MRSKQIRSRRGSRKWDADYADDAENAGNILKDSRVVRDFRVVRVLFSPAGVPRPA